MNNKEIIIAAGEVSAGAILNDSACAASRVNPIGKIVGNAGVFKSVADGQKITISTRS
ncbi:MAG: hypothetical protein KAU28_00845 [Phycisphaerae bacterium]|nr:hypothetical protein [Phycisphaerae bacterium]